jgi:hypothetical protein
MRAWMKLQSRLGTRGADCTCSRGVSPLLRKPEVIAPENLQITP